MQICVPFLSSNSEVKLFLEEAHIDSAVDVSSANSYMCLYIGMNLVLLTASYTHPAWALLGKIKSYFLIHKQLGIFPLLSVQKIILSKNNS